MKKMAALMMMICLVLCMMTSALADKACFNWQNTYTSIGIPDARFGLDGDGETGIVFFAVTSGNGRIELNQKKGTCQELSCTKLISGLKGTAKEWGKYEITVAHEETNTRKTYQWDNTFNNDSITLKLTKAGHYYIYVRPYTKNEMTNSYLLDMFAGWQTPPQWWIESTRNCNLSTVAQYGNR